MHNLGKYIISMATSLSVLLSGVVVANAADNVDSGVNNSASSNSYYPLPHSFAAGTNQDNKSYTVTIRSYSGNTEKDFISVGDTLEARVSVAYANEAKKISNITLGQGFSHPAGWTQKSVEINGTVIPNGFTQLTGDGIKPSADLKRVDLVYTKTVDSNDLAALSFTAVLPLVFDGISLWTNGQATFNITNFNELAYKSINYTVPAFLVGDKYARIHVTGKNSQISYTLPLNKATQTLNLLPSDEYTSNLEYNVARAAGSEQWVAIYSATSNLNTADRSNVPISASRENRIIALNELRNEAKLTGELRENLLIANYSGYSPTAIGTLTAVLNSLYVSSYNAWSDAAKADGRQLPDLGDFTADIKKEIENKEDNEDNIEFLIQWARKRYMEDAKKVINAALADTTTFDASFAAAYVAGDVFGFADEQIAAAYTPGLIAKKESAVKTIESYELANDVKQDYINRVRAAANDAQLNEAEQKALEAYKNKVRAQVNALGLSDPSAYLTQITNASNKEEVDQALTNAQNAKAAVESKAVAKNGLRNYGYLNNEQKLYYQSLIDKAQNAEEINNINELASKANDQIKNTNNAPSTEELQAKINQSDKILRDRYNLAVEYLNKARTFVPTSEDQILVVIIENAYIQWKSAYDELGTTPVDSYTLTDYTTGAQVTLASASNGEDPLTTPNVTGSSKAWLWSLLLIPFGYLGWRFSEWFRINPGWQGPIPAWWWYSNNPPIV